MAALLLVGMVASAVGLMAPEAGAATSSFSLTMSSGSWTVLSTGTPPGSGTPPQAFPSQSGPALAGQVDPTTGTITNATLTLPENPDICNATGCTNYKWYETDPGSATGSIDSDGNITINDSLTIELDVITVTETCITNPVNVTLHSTAPYNPTTGDVTLVASGFTIPDFTTAPNCGLASAQLNSGTPPNGVAGNTNTSLTLNLAGTLPIPPPPGTPSVTTLTTSPTSPQLQGTSVNLSAAITSGGTPPSDATGSIEFLDGTTVLNSQTVTPGTTTYTYATASLPGGTNPLTAVYSGGAGYRGSTSNNVAYQITPLPAISANLPPTLTVPTTSAVPTVTAPFNGNSTVGAALSPNGGPASGGTTVTIMGSGFTQGTTVDFGTTPATGVVVNNPTSITATSPPGTGTVDVTVATTAGTSATSVSDLFAYSAPTVTAVSPNTTTTVSGTSVTIAGTNFVPGATVSFGSGSTVAAYVTSSTLLTAGPPTGTATGTVDVTVTTPVGTSATSPVDQFTFVAPPPPTVPSPKTTAGPTAGGTSVAISGTNLGTNLTDATVDFGTTPGTITVNTGLAIAVTSPPGTGTVPITVTTPGGTTTAGQFTYTNAPVVTSISTPAGSPAGGTAVTITGINFTTANAVHFGSVATTFTVVSATSITTTSPTGTTGTTVDVTVTSPFGTSTTSAADQFTYGPAVTSISPATGLTAGGTSVTINGADFATGVGATTVMFGQQAATVTGTTTATKVTATSPSGSAGVVNITVTTTSGTSPVVAADQFTYSNVPAVTSISPVAGPLAGTTAVTITGSGFVSGATVDFGSTPATGVVVNSATSITATSPAGSGTVNVTVTTTGGTSATSAADQFTYDPVPTVTGVSPTTGTPNGDAAIVVSGTGFATGATVNFGTNPATSVVVVSSTSITAFTPAGTGGATVDVTITTHGGTSATSGADQYTYGAALPSVTALNLTTGAAAGGTVVTVTGTGFVSGATVDFGTAAATGVVVNSSTSITATSPAGSGTVDVTVTTAGGTSATSTTDQFTYGAPVVSSVSPNAGPTTGGTSVTIDGTGFTGATAVKFGTIAAASFTVTNAGSIVAVTAVGTGTNLNVTVTTPVATSATSTADRFTYNTAPSVSSLSPKTGPVNGGTVVTITGVNFTGATGVNFGTTPATGVVVVSSTSITAISPAGSGAADVTVVAPTGTSATGPADAFGYGAPAVAGVAPNTGLVVGGTTVVIDGIGFVSGATVSFGGVPAAAVVVVNATTITAISPAGTGTIDVTVTTVGGTSATTPATDQFTYSAGSLPGQFSYTITNPSATSGAQNWGNLYLQLVVAGISNQPNTNLTLEYQDTSGGWCTLTPTGTATTSFIYYLSGVGSSCSAPGSFALAPGASLTIQLELAYATGTYLGPQSVTTTLYSGTCSSSTVCAQSGTLAGNVTSTGTIELVPLAPLATTTTDAASRPATTTVRQGFNVEVATKVAATVAAPTSVAKPTGTVSYFLDGTPITGPLLQAGGLAYGPSPVDLPLPLTSPNSLTVTAWYPTGDLSPGVHTLVSQYSGDGIYAPSSLTETFTVLAAPAGATQFSCTVSDKVKGGGTAVGWVTATSAATTPTPAGTSALVTGMGVTLDIDPVVATSGINTFPQQPATFILAPGGTTTGGPITFTGTTSTALDEIGTWSGMSALIPITGSPGSTVPISAGTFAFTTDLGSVSCTPATTNVPIANVTVAGTTLTTSPSSPVVAGTPVTLNAQVAPVSASNPGTVEFFDGSTSLGTVVLNAAGQASLTTNSLAAGSHSLTANWSGTSAIVANTSDAVSFDVGTAPVVTTQPSDETVNVGDTASFTAAGSGTPDPTVQWQVSTDGGATWNDIDGATNTTYVTPVTTIGDNNNQYQAVFTNSVGSVTTSAATLTVQSAPVVTTSPTSQTVVAGQGVSFTAVASGSPTPTVQWQVSTDGGSTWSNVSGATSDSLSFTAASGDNANQYQAVFTNVVSSATSRGATLVVNDAPVATTQPQSQSANAGNAVTFTAAGTGKPAPTVQWQVSTDGGSTFTNINGATSASLTVTPGASANNNQYRAVFTNSAGATPSNAATLTVVATDGYRLVGADGAVFAYGDAGYYGSMGGKPLNKPIVGMAATPDNAGYWLVASDGGIFAFGDAAFYGSMGGQPLNKPIVGIATTPDGKGYWEVASDGGIFAFGDAAFYGSTGSMTLNKPIVGMAATPDGKGYWLVASDGGIFAFGDAAFDGSTGAMTLNAPITGMAASPDGGGYWLVASDGGIFTFGDATFHGAASAPSASVVAMVATSNGGGYWEMGADGSVYGLGNAQLSGSQAGQPLNAPIVGAST